ncbi:MAG: T9SS type A sorting domain-containing protein [Bacteroidia bacterium]|nr:T9SS type A sorting domain-containing protein [Bacteroidia bacterium]
MKTSFIYLICLHTLFSFVSWLPAKASHVAGSDMEFQCLGADSYKVILRIYRDCNGIMMNPTPQITFVPVAPCSQGSKSVTMTRTLFKPLRFICDYQKSVCEGGSFPFGIEENRFEATVVFKNLWLGGLDPNCCWLKVVYQECCRNGNVTNIQINNYYIEAELNRCVTPCNSSPQILNEPIAVICSGQPLWFNNGIVDTINYDSLSFELTDPLAGPNSIDSFVGSFTKDRPLNFQGFPNQSLPFPLGFHLNATTGDIGFTPTGTQQPVLAIKVTEWRKINGTYQKVGTTRRDAEFFITSCAANNPPEIAVNGNKNGPWIFNSCPGGTVCLKFTSFDEDSVLPKLDHTVLSWNKSIAGASWSNINSPIIFNRLDEAFFCWTPKPQHASTLPHYFTVSVKDDNCPVAGFTSRTIGIAVNGVAPHTIRATHTGNLTYLLSIQQTSGNGVPPTGIRWDICKGKTFVATSAIVKNGDSVLHTFDTGYYVTRLRLEAQNCVSFVFDTLHITGTNTGVWKFNTATGYAIYPNPTQHHFTVQCTYTGKYLVEMFDYTGKMSLQKTFNGTESTLDVSTLANGIYLVVITSENNDRITIKLVKK